MLHCWCEICAWHQIFPHRRREGYVCVCILYVCMCVCNSMCMHVRCHSKLTLEYMCVSMQRYTSKEEEDPMCTLLELSTTAAWKAIASTGRCPRLQRGGGGVINMGMVFHTAQSILHCWEVCIPLRLIRGGVLMLHVLGQLGHPLWVD